MKEAGAIVAGLLLVVSYCVVILLVRHFARWAVTREESRAHHFIPTVDERIEAELLVSLAEIDYWRGDVNDEFDRVLGRDT